MADPFENGLDAYNIGDYATAHRLWRPLAEQGNVAVQHSLGLMYANGQGVTKNYVEAAKWWRLAAEQGDAPAQFNLGVMYFNGLGVPQDYVRTHMWFDLLASRSPPGEEYDRAVKYRDAVAEFMTPDQIAEAQKLAREWKPRHEQAE